MSTRKLLRDVERALNEHGIVIVDRSVNGSTHFRLMVRDASGSRARITVACSPQCHEHAVNNTVQEARRQIRAASLRPAR